MTAWVAVGRALAGYVVGQDGIARPVGEFRSLPSGMPQGYLTSVDERLALYVNGRTFLIAVPTCDWCMAPVDGGGLRVDGGVFCGEECAEQLKKRGTE